MPDVSVIVPVYNTAKYIRECMNSLVGQTLDDIEIVVIDAGSTDGTLDILREYVAMDTRVKLLQSPRKSLGYQYNMGIDSAEGRYIAFCEADDYVDARLYEKLLEVLRSSSADYVKTDFDMFVGNESRFCLRYNILDGKMKKLYGTMFYAKKYPKILYRDVNMWNGLYRKSFITDNNIRLNETPKAAFQDMGFVLKCFLSANKISYISVPSYYYRRDNIKSSVYDADSVAFVVQEFEHILSYEGLHKADKIVQSVIARRFLDCFCGFYRKLPLKDQWNENLCKIIDRFFCKFKKFYAEIGCLPSSLECLNDSLSCAMILANDQAFDAFQRMCATFDNNRISEFLTYVSACKELAIFGAGEAGSCCYAMLKNNGYAGRVIFFDNDKSKWETRLMGIPIYDPDNIPKFKNYTFLIANDANKMDIYNQLIALGIDEKRIGKAVWVIPHLALEIHISNK